MLFKSLIKIASRLHCIDIIASNFQIPLSLQPDVKVETFLYNLMHSLKHLRSKTPGCKDIGIRQSEFVSKTQFYCP